MVLKPSEISKNTGKVLAKVLPRYLDQVRVSLCPTPLLPPVGDPAGSSEPCIPPAPLQSCFAVVLGGPEETGQLLEHEFDYIFFTGEGGPGWCPGERGMLKKRLEKAGEGGGDGQRCGASLMVIIWGRWAWQGGVLGLQGGGRSQWVSQDGARKVVPEPSSQEQLSQIPCSQGPLELARLSWLPPPST